ncbi:MAG: lipoyl synthase [Candidatus Omnitrophica bacterium]|jgi:lipoic acid synthetase|nr:lipoyl synthase [Candidatus Omnitrophota bacterium]
MKPVWLNKKINLNACSDMKRLLRESKLNTVCEQASCPNIAECFSHNQATFLILGKYCTRGCKFCNVQNNTPEAVDQEEPMRVAEAVKKLNLSHVVITSVTRDDLPDGGAKIFAGTVLSIRKLSPGAKIEILIPDFKLSDEALATVADSYPDIIAHNIETVPSLYSLVRQGASYQRSLDVLRFIKKIAPEIKTKSGIMLGMGEKEEEVACAMSDLRHASCDFLSIGQYLAPSIKHYPVKEYVTPEKFAFYKEKGMKLGFLHVQSSPYTRSSYMAHEYLKE